MYASSTGGEVAASRSSANSSTSERSGSPFGQVMVATLSPARSSTSARASNGASAFSVRPRGRQSQPCVSSVGGSTRPSSPAKIDASAPAG